MSRHASRFMADRREFLRLMGGAAGAGVVIGGAGLSLLQTGRADAQLNLKPFVDALPVPSVITPSGMLDDGPLYKVTMRVFQQKLHRDLPPTTLWGYNSMYPGPTFEARRGRPISVQWMNGLPSRHMFPIDRTLHGAGDGQPDVRTVVHLHGHKVLPDSDGYPEAWFTRDFRQTGPFFETRTYHYPNDQPATQLWYHDHALGATRLNNYAGLAGVYLIRDDVEDDLDLPSGDFEIPLVIQDRFFNRDGSLLYPVEDNGGDPDPRVPPVWIPEFFGDTVLVNGKVWPFLEVEPRKYRFRILNASNARFYHLTLNESTSDGTSLGRRGPAFHQIGSDGGFLPAPVRRTDLTIGVAERFDVVLDFSDAEGQSFVLNNDAKAPFPDGTDVVPTNVMLFKVTKRLRGRDTSSLPRSLAPVPLLRTSSSVRTRDLVLSELDSAEPFVNPIIALINAPWADPVTENPKAESVEIWRIINTTGDAHPIHIHLVQFQILDRQLFDPTQYPDRLVFKGSRVEPPPDERPAFKDTVKAMPSEVTRLIMKFDLPSGTHARDGERFQYVFHCHILEHEDNDMMRPYAVVG